MGNFGVKFFEKIGSFSVKNSLTAGNSDEKIKNCSIKFFN